MRFLITNLLILFCTAVGVAQVNFDYNWMFGSGKGLDHPNGSFIMSFNNGEVAYENTASLMDVYRANTSMSDSLGNLLFYTNNCYVSNSEHTLMEGGEDLDSGIVTNYGWCDAESGNANPQSAFIIPHPSIADIYYLFHLSAGIHQAIDGSGYFFNDDLNYSVIDMTEEEGLGKVIEKNILLYSDTMDIGQFSAVKHADNESWWIVNKLRNRAAFVTFLFDANGISGPFFQEIGEELPLFGGRGNGRCVFSPDGTKFVSFDIASELQYYNFDRETGLFSDFIKISIPHAADSLYQANAAFSSNSRFLYLSGYYHLYQVDTQSGNIEESLTLIDRFNDLGETFPAYFYRMQLGPDCRIYMTTPNGTPFLHVIDQPDEPGLACNFVQRGIHLPKPNSLSIPHFPHYRLGTDVPICDPSIVAPIVYQSSTVDFMNSEDYRFSPNPTHSHVLLENFKGFAAGTEWLLTDLTGRKVQQQSLTAGAEQQYLDLVGLPAGVYIQSVLVEGVLTWRAKVVVVE